MVFLFFIYSCSCATYVRIRLFSVSRQGLPLRDVEEEIARDKRVFVTYHFDVRMCCLWFMFNVAKVRCVIRAQNNISSAQCACKDQLQAVHACSVVAMFNASEAPFEDMNSLREHGLSIALYVLNRHVFHQRYCRTRGVVPIMLVSRGRSNFRSYSHLRRYKQSHLKSSW